LSALFFHILIFFDMPHSGRSNKITG
jgi:hypothetical protein